MCMLIRIEKATILVGPVKIKHSNVAYVGSVSATRRPMISILVSLKSIYFFLPCVMSFSLWDSLPFGGYLPSTPFYFSPGKDDTRCRRCVLTTGVWNIFWHENCCFISAVFNLTEADDKTTSEAAEATTVLPATVAPVVPQSVQGLWFCHAHYQSRLLLLRQKSQGNAVDWRTLSSSTQCNLTCTISVS